MIPYGRQSINQDIIVTDVGQFQDDFLTTGLLVQQFELALEKIVGIPLTSELISENINE